MYTRLALVCALVPGILATPTLADGPGDLSAAIGDFSADSTGEEVVIQSASLRDAEADGIPEGYAIRFDVYPLGASQKLYSSRPRIVSTRFPDAVLEACTPDDFAASRPASSLIRAGKRVVSVGGYALQCAGVPTGSTTPAPIEYHRTWVYGAIVTTSGGGSWRYQTTGEASAAAGIDTDEDGVFDQVAVSITVQQGTETDSTVVVLDARTGTVLSKSTYPVVQ